MPAKDDTFLGRWSRRKQEVAREERQLAPVEVAEPEAPEVALDDLSDAEVLETLGLPDPDDLQMGDDFKRYLATAVPARIRQRALRKLWLSNPVLANLDGLNDYEQDFTDAATMAKDVATSYELGRGFAKRLTDLVEKLPEEDAAPEPEEIEPEKIEEEEVVVTAYHPAPLARDDEARSEAPRAPRRMAFTFEEGSDKS